MTAPTFRDVTDRANPEELRRALRPRLAHDAHGVAFDERRMLRDLFSAALTEFAVCLRTALSSRSFFEDSQVPEALIERYKQDLRFLAQVRRAARSDLLKTIDRSDHAEQLDGLVDQTVVGTEVREVSTPYFVHRLGGPEARGEKSDEKTRNEAALMTTRLRKTIGVELADDLYAPKVFSGLLKKAIADAEPLFDHPRMQYALLDEFEQRMDTRATPGLPDAVANHPQTRAYFGAILMALGDEANASLDAPEIGSFVKDALTINLVVQSALAEHSLNFQDVESAIRRGLLTRFHATLGLEKTSAVIDFVLQITRAEMDRRT